MKIRYTTYLLLGILIFVTIFFFWASSPNYSLNEYSKLIINNHDEKINKDSIYSIVTYNIGYLSGMTNNKAIAKPKHLFDKNLENVKKEFRLLNADIIAFQEIDYSSERSYEVNQQNEIAELGYNHLAQAINWDETYVPFPYWPPSMHFGRMLSGQSILSKYPLRDHQRIVLERVKDNPFYRDALYLERLAQVVTVTIENRDIIIINVHLEAYDKSTRERQLDVVIDLFNKYKNDYPTILLGDFNSDIEYENPVINKLIKIDKIGNAAFDNNYDFTYSSANPFKRIDYIFYSKNSIELVHSKVLKQFGVASDHLPVEMKFRFK
jgi:endonuclease/exonuclease/phosphatase family metal-dependent hydrolase